jgi:hypothetical protein
MVQHNNHMMRLNSLPLRERAESPVLVEATRLLLCHDHTPSDLSCELEKAKQKFRDAVDAEAKKVCGSVMQLAIVEVLIWIVHRRPTRG